MYVALAAVAPRLVEPVREVLELGGVGGGGELLDEELDRGTAILEVLWCETVGERAGLVIADGLDLGAVAQRSQGGAVDAEVLGARATQTAAR